MPHSHQDGDAVDPKLASISIGSLLLGMLFSPCLLLVPYYLEAAKLGWDGILALSALYLVVSLIGLVGLVLLAHAGLSKLRWAGFERYAKAACGAVLICAALAGTALHGLTHDHDHHGHGHHAHGHHGHGHHHHDHGHRHDH